MNKAERTAYEGGYQVAIHGGLRGFCPYTRPKVFGNRLRQAWHLGFDAGQRLLAKNERIEL